MSRVRARFTCQEKVEYPIHSPQSQPTTGFRIKLSAVYVDPRDRTDPHAEEIARFFEATPSGVLEMSTVVGEVAKEFVPGRDYYLDFSPVELVDPEATRSSVAKKNGPPL